MVKCTYLYGCTTVAVVAGDVVHRMSEALSSTYIVTLLLLLERRTVQFFSTDSRYSAAAARTKEC